MTHSHRAVGALGHASAGVPPPARIRQLPRGLAGLFGSLASKPDGSRSHTFNSLLPQPTELRQQRPDRQQGPDRPCERPAGATCASFTGVYRDTSTDCDSCEEMAPRSEAIRVSRRSRERFGDAGRDTVNAKRENNDLGSASSIHMDSPPSRSPSLLQPCTSEEHHHPLEGFQALCSDACSDSLLGVQVGTCKLQAIIGHAKFGPVYYTTLSASGQREAVKVFEKSKVRQAQDVSNMWNEIRLVRKLRHPNVAFSLGAMHGHDRIFLRMEFGGQRNLGHFAQTRSLRVQQACRVGAQLASAVAYCHAQGVAHRDVHLANVAVSNTGSRIKLVDFGSAVSIGEVRWDLVGTMPFLAPEVMEVAGPGVAVPYDPAAGDVWSCGVVLVELLGGTGQLAGELGWGSASSAAGALVNPSAARAREVRALLARGVAEVFGRLATTAARSWSSKEELLEVLTGTFEVQPHSRWTAAELEGSAWLCRGSISSSA